MIPPRVWDDMGASYSGSTAVSKTACVGSIPTAPAKKKSVRLDGFFLYPQ